MKYLKTEQEIFWETDFGNKYVKRNLKSDRIFTIGKNLVNNKVFINEVLELGANVGLNLDAIKRVYPDVKTYGVEINKLAYNIGKKKHKFFNKPILNFKSKKKYDLVCSVGVLIHQNPKHLNAFYNKLYSLSKKYIYLSEYFNPTPVTIKYRNNDEKLFKRDFAKELWIKFPKLKLIDYGFHWKQDPRLKNCCDNSNWFLFQK
ncbi:MAG: pseudaminic acid biosynthesis-associated methylase [Candidatus Pelagibacter sp.]